MDFLGDILNSITSFWFQIEDETTSPEPTVASHNINPMNFGITAKPNNIINVPLPEEVQNTLTQILNSLASTDGGLNSPSDEAFASVTSSITTMDIPDKDGHTMVKIIEDMSGKTIEVIHEATTIISSINNTDTSATTIQTIPEGFVHSVNITAPSILHKPVDGASYTDIYIIAALILLIMMTMCVGIIVWCRKNKLKSVKRNTGEYPIVTEYMKNQDLSNSEKLKNVP